MLEGRELCVCEITEILQLAPSTVSKNLSVLREAKFILDRKDGKWAYYRLNQTKGTLYVDRLWPLIHTSLSQEQIIWEDREKASRIDRNTLCSI